MTKKWSSFKEQQLLTENFRNWLSEDDKQLDELNLFLEQRAVEKLRKINEPQMLKEMDIDIGGVVRIKTEFMKWATIAGISSAAMATAIQISAMHAGWEGVAIVFMGLVSNPVIVAIGGLAFLTAYMKSPFIRKIVNWIFKKILPDVTSKIAAGVEALINKMVEAAGGELTRENAIELYGMIVKHIIKDKEFRDKLKNLALAFVRGGERSKERIALLSSELDDLVERLIKDIMGVSEEEEMASVVGVEDNKPEEALPLAAQ